MKRGYLQVWEDSRASGDGGNPSNGYKTRTFDIYKDSVENLSTQDIIALHKKLVEVMYKRMKHF